MQLLLFQSDSIERHTLLLLVGFFVVTLAWTIPVLSTLLRVLMRTLLQNALLLLLFLFLVMLEKFGFFRLNLVLVELGDHLEAILHLLLVLLLQVDHSVDVHSFVLHAPMLFVEEGWLFDAIFVDVLERPIVLD